MGRAQKPETTAKTREEERLLGRIEELAARSERGYATYSHFLNPHERALAEPALRRMGARYQWLGGYPEAERAILAFLPDYLEDAREDVDCPLCLLEVEEKGRQFGRTLTHRDYLGALMSQQIERERVGDIVVQEGARVDLPAASGDAGRAGRPQKIGNHGVEVREVPLESFAGAEGQKERRVCFVASLRLDSVTAEGFGISRSQAAADIAAGLVSLRHAECLRAAGGGVRGRCDCAARQRAHHRGQDAGAEPQGPPVFGALAMEIAKNASHRVLGGGAFSSGRYSAMSSSEQSRMRQSSPSV